MSWSSYLYDQFNGDDGSLLLGRVPDTVAPPGISWLRLAPNQQILDNSVAGILSAGSECYVLVPLTAYRITARVLGNAAGGNPIVTFRSAGDGANSWQVRIVPTASGAGSSVILQKRVNSVLTGIKTFSNGIVTNQIYTIIIEVDGNDITMTGPNGTWSVTDSALAANIGMGVQPNNDKCRILDFLVETAMADSITISTPAAASSHVRTVSITGTTEGAPTSIEASIGGQDYQVIDPAPAANAFAGTYEYTHPIVGTLTVRWGNNHAITATQLNVTVTSNEGVPAGVTGGLSRSRKRRV